LTGLRLVETLYSNQQDELELLRAQLVKREPKQNNACLKLMEGCDEGYLDLLEQQATHEDERERYRNMG
jgi:hypothetical protein